LVLILNYGIRLGWFRCCAHRRSILALIIQNIKFSFFILSVRILILIWEMSESKFESNEL
jgi:hypothetical protein